MIRINTRKSERFQLTDPNSFLLRKTLTEKKIWVEPTKNRKEYWLKCKVGKVDKKPDVESKPEQELGSGPGTEMSDSDIGDAFINGKSIPLTIDTVSSKGDIITVAFKEKPWYAEIIARHITDEVKVKGRRIVESRKRYQETEMSIYKGLESRMGHRVTRKTRVDGGTAEKTQIQIKAVATAAEKVRDMVKNSIGLDLTYDPGHHFSTPEEAKRDKELKIKRDETAKVREQEEKDRKSNISTDADDLNKELHGMIDEGIVDSIFSSPEIGYTFVERIMDNRDMFDHLNDVSELTGNTTDKGIAMKSGEKILSMSKDDALNYIKDSSNREEIGTIFNVFMGVMG